MQQALVLAGQVHPAWHRCDDYAKRLHARNCMQILGRNLDEPADFVVCWTKTEDQLEEQDKLFV